MQSVKYIHWQEGDSWLGYLEEYPDYWTQGETLPDLIEHLKDLYLDLSGGHVPNWPWKKSSGTFSRHENLRFSRELRSRDRIPAIEQAVCPQPANARKVGELVMP